MASCGAADTGLFARETPPTGVFLRRVSGWNWHTRKEAYPMSVGTQRQTSQFTVSLSVTPWFILVDPEAYEPETVSV